MEKYTTNSKYTAIRDWREDERPREKLQKHGAHTLSDAELLAILISSGTKGFSALDAAKSLLRDHLSLSDMAALDESNFRKVPGIGPARAITLAAAFELARRVQSSPLLTSKPIQSPTDVVNYFVPRLMGMQKEQFRTVLLNSANKIIRDVIISEGSLNASIVHPREVFKLAISESAAAIILLHNHPSGNTEPSGEDINITKQLVKAGQIIGIRILDHIIIAGKEHTSLADRGYI